MESLPGARRVTMDDNAYYVCYVRVSAVAERNFPLRDFIIVFRKFIKLSNNAKSNLERSGSRRE